MDGNLINMKVWVNTELLPIPLEVKQTDDGFLYNGRLINVPVYLSYTSAIENMLTTLETNIVLLKAELQKNIQYLTDE